MTALAPASAVAGSAGRDELEQVRAGALRVRRVRARQRRRTASVCAALVLVLAGLFCAAMVTGDFPLPLSDLFASLAGHGTRSSDFIVYDLRLPRVLAGLLVGFAFGVSGAVFQALLKNPLASPDVLGITAGASASAVGALLVLGLGGAAVSLFAFGGAVGTALLIYGLSWRGGVAGHRLVLVGVGLAAVLWAMIDFLMTRAQVYDAQVALRWLTGSLSGSTAGGTRLLALALLVLVPLTLLASTLLRGLQLGDDTARGLGLRVEPARAVLILLAVALAAVATAAAGPVAFVAFVAGPVARRLTGGTGASLLPAGLVGAAVVVAADFAGQHLLPVPMPVGVLTAAVGAPYLLYLLVVSSRSGQGS